MAGDLIPAQLNAELSQLAARLRAAGDAVRDAQERLDLLLQQRNALIIEAVDVAGFRQAQVAELIGIGQPSVNRILMQSQPETPATPARPPARPGSRPEAR